MGRPVSDWSDISAQALLLPAAVQSSPRLGNGERERGSPAMMVPNRDSSMAPELASRPQMVNRDSASAPEAVVLSDEGEYSPQPYRDQASLRRPPHDRLSVPLPDLAASLGPTPELSPEIRQAESVSVVVGGVNASTATAVRMVEKRASAVGHSTTTANRQRALSKHRVSNASRFSFQFGDGGKAEEEVLEGKYRESTLMMGSAGGEGDEEDDEGEFDEGAMDDLDEFEVERGLDYHHHDGGIRGNDSDESLSHLVADHLTCCFPALNASVSLSFACPAEHMYSPYRQARSSRAPHSMAS